MDRIPMFNLKSYTMRGVKKEDASALFPFMSDEENMKFITPHPVQTIAEMEEILSQRLESFRLQKEIPWVIENGHKEVVGLFRFHKLNLWHKKTEMGAVIHPDYQRSGVMTDVFRAIIPYGFEELHLNRIVGDIFAKNEGSRKLLEKFGFREEGVLRQTDFDGQNFHDTVVFSMLKQEYHHLKQTFDQ